VARLPLRLRRHHEPDVAAAEGRPAPLPRAARRAAPPPGELRRERRTLLAARETRLRDLGGVVLEMYRQDDFRESLLSELCAEVSAIEERLQEVEVLLGAYRPAAARCTCGAPLFWGARFCGTCGRPLVEGAEPPRATA
jgi:hypothetical protein